MDPITFIILALIVGGGFFFWSQKPPAPEKVHEALVALGDDYRVCKGIDLRSDEAVHHVDYVLVSRYGLFVIQELRVKGKMVCEPRQVDWEVKGAGPHGRIYNPLWENRKRINLLERKLPGFPMMNLVVMAEGKALGDVPQEMVPFKELNARIKKFRHEMLSEDQIRQALKVLGQTE